MQQVLTVCIPTYKRARLLERCLRSVFLDLPPQVSVIVGNNASPDDTESVVAPYLDCASLTYFKNETNLGGDGNLLKLINAVRTPFFMILTDDDQLVSGALRSVVIHLETFPNVSAVISPLRSLREDGVVVHVRRTSSRVYVQQPGLISACRFADMGWTWSRLIFSTKAVRDLPVNGMISNCYFMILILGKICRTSSVLVLPEYLVNHTVGNEVFWDYMAPDLVRRRIFLERSMLAAVCGVFDGKGRFEAAIRRYWIYKVCAGYINAIDGLNAYRDLAEDQCNRYQILKINLMPAGIPAPSIAVFGYAGIIKAKNRLKCVTKHLLASLSGGRRFPTIQTQ